MGQANGGIGFINMLTAGAGRTKGIHAQIGFINFDGILRICLRHNGNGASRGMDSTLRLGIGYPLNTMGSRLKLELRVHARAHNASNDFFVTTVIARTLTHYFDLPALRFGKLAVHTK